MKNESVLIAGAGIGGPALAFWLGRYGFETTVVERAPALREGGHAVDFRGPAHEHVLTRMGILDDIRAVQTHMREASIVDATGKPIVALPSRFMSGDVEIERGDLSRILYERSKGSTEYVFGDCIRSMNDTGDGVEVTFERGRPRRFDLVVGADGLHSGVRALAFGDEARFLRFHGYYVAGFTAPNHMKLDHEARVFSVPGKSVSVSSARRPDLAMVLFVFASGPLEHAHRDVNRQKEILEKVYEGVGWEVPRLLEAMRAPVDMYFDSISHVELDAYAKGRVALLGDAAYGGTIGGQGTGLALVGSYVLAGELAAAGGDHRVAFAAYEERLKDYARACQGGAKRVGPFLAPPTRARTWMRNSMYRVLTSKPFAGLLEKLVADAASSIELRDYAAV